MTELVQCVVQEGVAVLTLSNPPVNALGQALRASLLAAVERSEADPAVRAIVIAAAGRSFPAGADIREFNRPHTVPGLTDLCRRIEICRKPVIAALHGTVLGGGLELALAAHYRVALATTRLGFPEINLGLLPGAGGTQRAPRLIGAAAALRLMLSGAPIPAAEALALGLIDAVEPQDVLAAALVLALDGLPVRPTLDRADGIRDPAVYQAAIAAARTRQKSGLAGPRELLAPARIVDCVEAALLLPPLAGLEFERAAFADCLASEASAGLRHAFFAERRAVKGPEAGVSPRPVQRAGVVGAGQIGGGLAFALLSAGLHVVVIERDRDALITAFGAIATAQQRAVEAGKLTEAAREADWARLGGSLDPAGLSEADLVFEALPEDLGLKSGVLAELGAVLRPGAVIASTTEALDLAVLAAASGRGDALIGFHMATPLPASRLVEIGVTGQVAPDAAATGFALAKRLGCLTVRVAGGGGAVAAHLAAACRSAGDALVRQGVTGAAVNGALREYGLRGLYPAQTGSAAERSLAMPAADIRRRCLAAMINEGVRMLADGAVRCPSDVDVVSVMALGLPRWRGGLLKMADLGGLLALSRDLADFAADDPAIWTPHPLLGELIKNGQLLDDLNEG